MVFYFPEKEALAFKEEVIEQVKSKKFIVVCDGINEKILPSLKTPVPKVNRVPIGPHPCGSYEVKSVYFNKNIFKQIFPNFWLDVRPKDLL